MRPGMPRVSLSNATTGVLPMTSTTEPAIPCPVNLTISTIDRILASAIRYSSARLVFVVAAPPETCLVAPLGRAVEPLIHAPEPIQSARVGGVGVIDGAVLEHERAHARPLSRI